MTVLFYLQFNSLKQKKDCPFGQSFLFHAVYRLEYNSVDEWHVDLFSSGSIVTEVC